MDSVHVTDDVLQKVKEDIRGAAPLPPDILSHAKMCGGCRDQLSEAILVGLDRASTHRLAAEAAAKVDPDEMWRKVATELGLPQDPGQ